MINFPFTLIEYINITFVKYPLSFLYYTYRNEVQDQEPQESLVKYDASMQKILKAIHLKPLYQNNDLFFKEYYTHVL